MALGRVNAGLGGQAEPLQRAGDALAKPQAPPGRRRKIFSVAVGPFGQSHSSAAKEWNVSPLISWGAEDDHGSSLEPSLSISFHRRDVPEAIWIYICVRAMTSAI
ncbi:hypothetical protein LOK46_11950 [Methylobacterium sp. NMS14P]|uniref:hypothetical protein n=1 Tax=Methylobacterium sp. NMS14P TaxID=2894310 RepID=UPI0023595180|nr:hypothetical protein [Methylobacterium sp. NMS14P]WCS27499.1 hypothetical protein LOK46_11950 [Methylobacterium sp. NMS14P]